MSYATETERGTSPPSNWPGRSAAMVKFDDTSRRYRYWVDPRWNLKIGDKLKVIIPSGAYKLVEVTSVVHNTTLMLSLKAAANVFSRKRPKIEWPEGSVGHQIEQMERRATRIDSTCDTTYSTVNGYSTCPGHLNPKETVMDKNENESIKVESKVFVTLPNGQGARTAEHLSDDELFEAIKRSEERIAELKALNHQPKSLVKKVEELEKGIDDLIAYMDGRETK